MSDKRERPKRWRRRAVVAAIAAAGIVGAVLLWGWLNQRSAPSRYSNALVLHVITDDCDSTTGFLKVPAHRFLRVEGCSDPLGDSDGRLQVWRTDYGWGIEHPALLAVGERRDNEALLGASADDYLRIDHDHVLIGIIDIRHHAPVFTPPARHEAISSLLSDRQGCEDSRRGSCGIEWRHADPFTLESVGGD